MKNNNSSSNGLGLASVLAVIFVVLKLVGVISWSWVWVLSPIWISWILGALVLAGFTIYFAYDDKKYEKEYGTCRKRNKKDKWKF